MIKNLRFIFYLFIYLRVCPVLVTTWEMFSCSAQALYCSVWVLPSYGVWSPELGGLYIVCGTRASILEVLGSTSTGLSTCRTRAY